MSRLKPLTFLVTFTELNDVDLLGCYQWHKRVPRPQEACKYIFDLHFYPIYILRYTHLQFCAWKWHITEVNDLQLTSGVKLRMPPHLKWKLRSSRTNPERFMLLSQKARFSIFWELNSPTIWMNLCYEFSSFLILASDWFLLCSNICRGLWIS